MLINVYKIIVYLNGVVTNRTRSSMAGETQKLRTKHTESAMTQMSIVKHPVLYWCDNIKADLPAEIEY